jgi:hypothetical protein
MKLNKLFLPFFLFPSVIFAAVPAIKPCGLQGSIEERIKDCAQVKGNFALVAVNEKGNEFYKDTKSNLIWGNRIASDFNHYGSQKACSDEVSEYLVLNSLKWRLPTVREFEDAATHGIKVALTNMDHTYWTSTPVKVKRSRRNRGMPSSVFLWDGYEQKTDTGDLKDGASVRCVAKE